MKPKCDERNEGRVFFACHCDSAQSLFSNPPLSLRLWSSTRVLSSVGVNMQVVLFVAFWLQVWTSVTGYSAGAPAAKCVDMTPQHGVPAQSGPSPYTIRVSNTTFGTNQNITVTIDGPVYAGLLLKAGSGSSTDAVGTWGPPPLNTQYLACTGTQSAITHSNNVPKSNTTSYTWIPPASLNTAFITATVVSNKTTFWVNLTSTRLTSVGNGYAADDQKVAVLFLTLLMSALGQYSVTAPSAPFP